MYDCLTTDLEIWAGLDKLYSMFGPASIFEKRVVDLLRREEGPLCEAPFQEEPDPVRVRREDHDCRFKTRPQI